MSQLTDLLKEKYIKSFASVGKEKKLYGKNQVMTVEN